MTTPATSSHPRERRAAAGASSRASRGTGRRDARGRLLATARALFLTEGIRATGIDRVIAESDVAKATLYHHFATKEDLVVAVLEALLADWVTAAEDVDDPEATAAERVGLLFDALADSVRQGRFRGCPFSNAITELPSSRKVRRVAERYRAAQLAHVGALVGRGPDDPLCHHIVLLLEGATAMTKVSRGVDAIVLARDAAVAMAATVQTSHSPDSPDLRAPRGRGARRR